ncbi:MAG: hypothetical protein ACLSVU_00735 [Christensenellales bacterium]
MKKIALMLLTFLPLLLGGCTGGQEIESSLFVIAMAVDAAPEGNLTITVKALSGSQESAASGASGAQSEAGSTENLEQTETGYIVLSATAPSCLRALGLLGATTPRTSILPAAGNRHQPDAGRNGCDALHPQADSRHLPRQRRSRRRRHAGSCGRFHPQTARRARLAPVQVS